jgi:hypothetical protein
MSVFERPETFQALEGLSFLLGLWIDLSGFGLMVQDALF